jgi:dCMP deaminase
MQDWNKWHRRFMCLAREVSTWSNDPTTQTGFVIVSPVDNRVVSLGYNGFPRYVQDSYARLSKRSEKLKYMVHAEDNAIIAAREPLQGYTGYCWPWPPCGPCAAHVVQAGLKQVVAVQPTQEQEERWGDSFDVMRTIFREGGVRLDLVPAYWLSDEADEY